MYGKKKMKKGGKLKPVDSKKNPGLAKLPTDVRNKMGYMAYGGKMSDTDKDFMYGGKMMKKMARGGTFEKVAEKRDDMMMRFKGFTGMGTGINYDHFNQVKKRKKKMMKGGKMNYPGGGRIQHD